MNMMDILVYMILIFIFASGVYLLLNCIYLLFFAIAGHFLVHSKEKVVTSYRSILVIIPAYKENEVIIESSLRAIKHVYEGKFDVCVIADGLNQETVLKIANSGCKVIKVNFERSTKGKSLLYAMDHIEGPAYDIALILDIDNIMDKGFLNEVNAAFDHGAKVVQTHRTAKNLNTPFAFLDACNEEINNHIYRKGHAAVGLSPALIGSGMAFEYSYLHNLLKDIGETVGEDKEMDFKIARDRTKIVYLNDTYVFDEKIEDAAVFTQQRTRWIAAQIEFFKKYFKQGFIELFKNGNFEFFNKVLQSMLVPRMLLLGLLGLLSLISILFLKGEVAFFFPVLFLFLCLTLAISLPSKFYKDTRLWMAIVRIPYALWCMVIALFSIRKTKSSFLHTPHAVNSETHDHSSKI